MLRWAIQSGIGWVFLTNLRLYRTQLYSFFNSGADLQRVDWVASYPIPFLENLKVKKKMKKMKKDVNKFMAKIFTRLRQILWTGTSL